MYRAIFLDRDGVINEAEKYVVHPDDFTFLPGAIEALKLISKKDYKIIVITNQSGVRRGYYDEEMLQRIHQKMLDELKLHGVSINHIYYCPHHPDDGCDCRKPAPGMLHLANHEHHIDLANSFMIGDRDIDILAGKEVGAKTILLRCGYQGDDKYRILSDFIAEDLLDAVQYIN